MWQIAYRVFCVKISFMTKDVVLFSIPVNDLQTLIIDCVNACLKHYSPPQSEISDLPEFLTRKQAAKMLSVSLGTLDAWTREGRLTKHRAGAVVRYRKDELVANFKSLREGRYQRFLTTKEGRQ
jgi:excisionase family DNA binding protein